MLVLNHNYLHVSFTHLNTMCTIECEQTYPYKPIERIKQSHCCTLFLEHEKNIDLWKESEKGHQCIKTASLYETLKIQHPSFNILKDMICQLSFFYFYFGWILM